METIIEYLKKIAHSFNDRPKELRSSRIDFFEKVIYNILFPNFVKFNLDIIPVFIERSKDNKFILEFQTNKFKISTRSFSYQTLK